jgi:xanthine dehydrogenase YagS FAD-binding subunit
VALVALDATMRVRGPLGERVFPVEDLYRLPGDTPHLEHTLKPGEIITEIRVPEGPHSRHARYLKVRDRASYEFALVSIAAALDIEGGVIREARMAAGGVGTRPWRLRECESALRGQKLERPVLEKIAQLASQGTRPLDHNGYKVELLPRTILRALEMAGEIA